MDVFREIYAYLPGDIADALKERMPPGICEIRLTVNRPILVSDGLHTAIFTPGNGRRLVITKDILEGIMTRLTGGSIYSVSDHLAEGYITLTGGHRVGVMGTAVVRGNGISHIRQISAINFRISREVRGCCLPIVNELETCGRIANILIASPPGCGKTTYLRDLCRIISNGELSCGIRRVGIADERGEIAAVKDGIPGYDVGVGSFVCDGYPKALAMMAMLRSMSPDVIATDEIGTREDFDALAKALCCGVSVIATAHAGDLCDLKRRFENELNSFDKIVLLKERGRVSRIYRRGENGY